MFLYKVLTLCNKVALPFKYSNKDCQEGFGRLYMYSYDDDLRGAKRIRSQIYSFAYLLLTQRRPLWVSFTRAILSFQIFSLLAFSAINVNASRPNFTWRHLSSGLHSQIVGPCPFTESRLESIKSERDPTLAIKQEIRHSLNCSRSIIVSFC